MCPTLLKCRTHNELSGMIKTPKENLLHEPDIIGAEFVDTGDPTEHHAPDENKCMTCPTV